MASPNVSPLPQGVHLVGSVRLPNEPEDAFANPPTAKDVFRAMLEALPQRLERIPDGETGPRRSFVLWLDKVFLPSPWIMRSYRSGDGLVGDGQNDAMREIKLNPPGYDDYAVQSYRVFTQLREEGIIPPGVRFQVSLATPPHACMVYVKPEYQARVAPLFEDLLKEAVKNMQKQIPAEDLAIQWDCAVEFAMLEEMGGLFTPWYNAIPDAVADRMARLGAMVDEDVQLGFHLCYGDIEHQHFKQPEDTIKLVEMANLVSQKLTRPINWIHLPVPMDRKDDAYFEPLRMLDLSKETEVYLGLVHPNDKEGALERIATARKVIDRFGVATECGWGRTPVQDISSILETLKAASQPIQDSA